VMSDLEEPYEIIFIDDGSTDDSFSLLNSLHQADSRVRVVRLIRNFGQHPAVTAGFDVARGDIIITMDSDLQDRPEELPKLLKKLDEGYEVVVGYRSSRQAPFWRKALSRIYNWLIYKYTGTKLKDYGSMLRVYRREVIEVLKTCRERSHYITALVGWLGVSTAEVEVIHDTRASGSSKYSIPKLIKINYDLMTSFSALPIQIVSATGFLFALVGFIIGLYLVGYRIVVGAGVGGIVSYLAIGFFFIGVLLFAIGLLGEYIARIFLQVQGRPIYIIKEERRERN
jgi:undecaprenyl-phosphate 4-deoxy-4-formamido-L-arabinose transferase